MNILKMLEKDNVRDAWNEVMEALIVEKLKEDYLLCLDWADIENATAILTTLRYFTPYHEFTEFLQEVRDAGYSIKSTY